jgi:hypothetical protein
MAAPEFVPTHPLAGVRSYSSPPQRSGSWIPDRPGEIHGRQPVGEQLGVPGPDQGYALTLAASFRGKLELVAGEHEADALAGASAIAMKRSGVFGRSPVVHDLRVGLSLWGFLDATCPADLLALRQAWFDEVHLAIHYRALRRIADAVSAELLGQPHAIILAQSQADWRSCLDLEAL